MKSKSKDLAPKSPTKVKGGGINTTNHNVTLVRPARLRKVSGLKSEV